MTNTPSGIGRFRDIALLVKCAFLLARRFIFGKNEGDTVKTAMR